MSTFSEEVISKSNKTITVTDSLGRIITLRKPKFSHYLDLLKALGPELSKNSTYFENVAICSAVVSIHDPQDSSALVPVNLRTPLDIDFLVRDLEKSDDAFIKVAEAISSNFSDYKSVEEYKNTIKK